MSRREFGQLSDEKLQERQRERNKLKGIQIAADWKTVMASRAGRNVLSAIIAESDFGSADVYESEARNRIQQGRQLLGRFIVDRMRLTDLSLYRLMEDEARGVEPSEPSGDRRMSGTTTEVVPSITTPAPVVAQPSTLIPDPAAAPVVPDPAKPAVSAEVKTVEAPKAPEKYEFKLPEGVTIAQPLMDGFTTLAKAANLPQAEADKFLALHFDIQKAEKSALDQQYADARAAWIKASMDDPTIGGAKYDESIIEARKAIKWANDPELESMLLESGFEAHPAVLRLFLKIQQAIGEDKGGGTSVSGGQKTEADRLREMYPNSPELFGGKKD